MKKILGKLLLVVGCAAFVCAADIGVSHAAQASASASGKVILPLTISKTGDLQFGTFIKGSGGTVVIAPSGTRTPTGVTVVAASTSSAATFDVGGEPSATFSISLPADGAVALTHGSDTMPLSSFQVAAAAGTLGTLDGGGAQTLNVGATATVGANQASGDYTASFDVTVNYN